MVYNVYGKSQLNEMYKPRFCLFVPFYTPISSLRTKAPVGTSVRTYRPASNAEMTVGRSPRVLRACFEILAYIRKGRRRWCLEAVGYAEPEINPNEGYYHSKQEIGVQHSGRIVLTPD